MNESGKKIEAHTIVFLIIIIHMWVMHGNSVSGEWDQLLCLQKRNLVATFTVSSGNGEVSSHVLEFIFIEMSIRNPPKITFSPPKILPKQALTIFSSSQNHQFSHISWYIRHTWGPHMGKLPTWNKAIWVWFLLHEPWFPVRENTEFVIKFT